MAKDARPPSPDRVLLQEAAEALAAKGYEVRWPSDARLDPIPFFYVRKDGDWFHVRGFPETKGHLIPPARVMATTCDRCERPSMRGGEDPVVPRRGRR
jgi:hypothetical protein